MRKRSPFAGFEGVVLGAMSIVALIIATVITMSFDIGAPSDTGSPPSQVAEG
jgi:hypothetical protein